MIEVIKLTKNYGKIKAVKGINLNIKSGVFYGLLGPNGAGKTTTLKMLSTSLQPSEGSINILGKALIRNSKDIQAKIGVVPQHYSLEKELTVRETLIHHGLLHQMTFKAIRLKIDELIDFAKMKDHENKLTSQLSGGNKRKLMIIRAMMHEPSILFLDEPTVGLDAAIRRQIWDLLKKLKTNGLTIIITTHYIEEARVLCDVVGMMNNGLIVKENTPEGYLEELPDYVVEVFNGIETKYSYFDTKHEANQYMEQQEGDMRLRHVNLEDVYVKYTNQKVGNYETT